MFLKNSKTHSRIDLWEIKELKKLIDNLELIWFSGLGISTSYTLTKIVLEDSLLFAIKNVRNDNIYFVDPKTGNLISKNNFEEILSKIPFKNNLISEIISNKSDLIYRVYKNLKIDNKNNQIIFYN